MRQEVELAELFVRSLVRPDADETEFVVILKPRSDLLDGSLLNVMRQRRLTG